MYIDDHLTTIILMAANHEYIVELVILIHHIQSQMFQFDSERELRRAFISLGISSLMHI